MILPNRFPTNPSSKKIALISEFPSSDDVRMGAPFSGMSGRFLSALLAKAGIAKESCLLAHVCQHNPPGNILSNFKWDGPEIQGGLEALTNDIAKFDPNICVLFGSLPLKAAKDPSSNHPLITKRYEYSPSNWRGSLLLPDSPTSPFAGRKCLSALSPAYVLRAYDEFPLLMFDLNRAAEESNTKDLVLPTRRFDISLSVDELIAKLFQIRVSRSKVALDIEGGLGTMSCVSFATSPDYAFIVPILTKHGQFVFSPADHVRIWRALAAVLEDPGVPKVLQNSLYDRFVLQYSYSIRMRGIVHDTMLSGWEINAELPKSLGVQTSLWTREPYYKGDRKSDDDATFYRYCCMDSAVTLEISNRQVAALAEPALSHYLMNVALLNPLLYMEQKGIRYNSLGAALRRSEIQRKQYEAQAKLNLVTGHRLPWKGKNEVFAQAQTVMGKKRGDVSTWDALAGNCLKPYVETVTRLRELMLLPNPTLATIGEVEDLLEVSLNVSSEYFKTYLYEHLHLPPQYKENAQGEPALTADYEALLKLAKHCLTETSVDPRATHVIRLAMEIRALDTRAGMLAIHADGDERIRCGYNIVGSETGRVTCYTSPTGSGYNLQTIPNYTNRAEAPGGLLGDRDLFLADEGHWFFQCDLKGADGWTVAAYSAMLGDRTMLEDYLYGLKPANILALMLRGVSVDFSDRLALKGASKQVGKDDWDYFACKRVQHGAAYLEGGLTISRNILKDSEGKLFMSQTECNALKTSFFTRYPGIRLWHNWVSRQCSPGRIPVFTAASGQVRKFFGRPDDLQPKIVAHEPQSNTTYVTNLAMYNLWTDPENRMVETGGQDHDGAGTQLAGPIMGRVRPLRIEPLHQVHDALCGQFRKSDTPWAVAKIKSYFDNPVTIAGQTLVIPFDGGYGESWGNLKEGVI